MFACRFRVTPLLVLGTTIVHGVIFLLLATGVSFVDQIKMTVSFLGIADVYGEFQTNILEWETT